MTTAGVPPLRVRTVRVPPPDGGLLGRLPEGSDPAVPLAWVRAGEGMVGLRRCAAVTTHGPGRFAEAQAWWDALVAAAHVEDEVALPGSGLVAFGAFAYAAGSSAGATLVVPRTVFGRRKDTWWRTDVEVVRSPDASGGASADGPELADGPEVPAASGPPATGGVTIAEGALTGAEWGEAVALAVERIGAGDVDKLVLARDLLARSGTDFDVAHLLRALAGSYPRTWVFAVDGLVGATPEMLVRLEKGLATSRVLAGTIRRTGHDEADLALAASLARSSKDLEEHEYAVRSVADALEPHCTSMNVPETPFVLHLPNVMHLATDVAGRTSNGASALDLAEALHPSAAVCGTPRAAAEPVIAELERMDRGRYAGPVGWMDATGDGEWGIALRCGQVDPADPRTMRIFAGCGIVAGSDPASELAESEAKFVPMRGALTSG
ncbi:isochorismate synthase [Agilicoccus flavus]|uniref:isochorismate synthase n=1 Tax=Agilicoccus flavus TaxID=2775968 RepID=UPI003556119B